MAHLSRDYVTGHLLRGASGHLVNDCYKPCGNCTDDKGPRTIIAVVSGVAGCPDCIDGHGISINNISLTSVNGTFVLKNEGDPWPCKWCRGWGASCSAKAWVGYGCTGAFWANVGDVLDICVEKTNATTWKGDIDAADWVIFSGTATVASGACYPEDVVINNAPFADCAWSNDWFAGTGGSMTISTP